MWTRLASFQQLPTTLISVDLNSDIVEVRREAARTLATIAPSSLEPLLLSFATSKDFILREFAPLALGGLNTEVSHRALAEMLLSSQPGSYEYVVAVRKLAQTHDPAWLPLLLEVAHQNGVWYLSAAAESGGEAAIPDLLARVRDPDPKVRDAAIDALGSTGSHAAIPPLLSLLAVSPAQKAPFNDVSSANRALTRLTHLRADPGADGEGISTLQRRWEGWWRASEQSATIYQPNQCGPIAPLP